MTKANVQQYLIESARRALLNGDKSAAKASLLTARYLSQKDANVTFEIYSMAKAEGDIKEAANCFANIFRSGGQSLIKDEIENIIDELKLRHLKLESSKLATPPPAGLTSAHSLRASRVSSTASSSGSISQVLTTGQMSIRTPSRDSLSLDSTIGSFHTQIYNFLDNDLKRELVLYTIETCGSKLEQSRLMLLAITLFPQDHESIAKLKPRLIDTLLQVCGRLVLSLDSSTKMDDDSSIQTQLIKSPSSSISMNYACSLLVADVMPLILSKDANDQQVNNQFSLSESDLHELILQTLKFYHDNCVRVASLESHFSDNPTLHQLDIERAQESKRDLTSRDLKMQQKNAQSAFAKCELTERRVQAALELLAHHFCWTSLFGETYQKENSVIERLKQIAACLDQQCLSNSGSLHQGDDGNKEATRARGRPKKQLPTTPTKSTKHVVEACENTNTAGLGQLPDKAISEPLYALIELMLHCLTRHLRYTSKRLLIETTPNPNKTYSVVPSSAVGDNDSSPKPAKRAKIQSNPEHSSTEKVIEKASTFVEEESNVKFSREHSTLSSPYLTNDTKQAPSIPTDIDDMVTAGDNLFVCVKSLRVLESHTYLSKYWNGHMSSFLLPMTGESWQRLSIDAQMLKPPHPHNGSSCSSLVNSFETKLTQMLSSPTSLTPIAQLRSWLHLACHENRKNEIDIIKLVNYCQKTLETGSNNEFVSAFQHKSSIPRVNYAKLFEIDAPPGSDYVKNCDARVVSHKTRTLEPSDTRHFTFIELSADCTISCALSMLFDFASERVLAIIDKSSNSSGALAARSAHAQLVDTAAGHLVVMSQFEWPHRAHLFARTINWLRKSKPTSATPQLIAPAHKFTYAPFFHYVLNPDVIEEFMALVRQGYTLDIRQQQQQQHHGSMPTYDANTDTWIKDTSSNATTAKDTKAITTRGLNKSYKDDMRSAFENQMHVSSVTPPVMLLSEFALTELISWLNSSQVGNANDPTSITTSSQRKRRS